MYRLCARVVSSDYSNRRIAEFARLDVTGLENDGLEIGRLEIGRQANDRLHINVAAQETAKRRAKFGWPPMSDIGAPTKARRETF